jgi:hypothetical protein
MRGLLLFGVWLALVLAIDAYGFDGEYRRAVMHEANYQTHRLGYDLQHFLTPPTN